MKLTGKKMSRITIMLSILGVHTIELPKGNKIKHSNLSKLYSQFAYENQKRYGIQMLHHSKLPHCYLKNEVKNKH